MKVKIAIVAAILVAIGIGTYAVVAKSCNDQDKVYKICSDQQAKYQADLATAGANNKLLLLEFGADWCPWCRAIHKLFSSSEFQQEFETSLLLSEIGIYNYDSKDKIKSGVAVLNDVLIANEKPLDAVKGYPFLVVMRPSDKKAVFIDTGDLEDNTNGKGHDPAKVRDALMAAIGQLR